MLFQTQISYLNAKFRLSGKFLTFSSKLWLSIQNFGYKVADAKLNSDLEIKILDWEYQNLDFKLKMWFF